MLNLALTVKAGEYFLKTQEEQHHLFNYFVTAVYRGEQIIYKKTSE